MVKVVRVNKNCKHRNGRAGRADPRTAKNLPNAAGPKKIDLFFYLKRIFYRVMNIPDSDAAAAYIRGRFPDFPFGTAVILGSGLGGFSSCLTSRQEIEAAQVPGWPPPTVSGHRGTISCGLIGSAPVTVLAGRIHYYEGHPIKTVVFPVQVLADLGVDTLIITNAAGGIDPGLAAGDLMLITDHLNLMGTNPLIGPNDDRRGPRFPDMSEPYNRELQDLALEAAAETGIQLTPGVLAATSGPSYETAAEIRMIRTLGGDAVCMSTVPEVTAAVHRGMRVLAVSCITNPATGLSSRRLSHPEVEAGARRAEGSFTTLLKAVIDRINRI